MGNKKGILLLNKYEQNDLLYLSNLKEFMVSKEPYYHLRSLKLLERSSYNPLMWKLSAAGLLCVELLLEINSLKLTQKTLRKKIQKLKQKE